MTKIKQTIVISLLLVGCLAAVKPAQALTYQELLDYFHQPQVLGASTTGLVGYWNFDEGSGTTANDSSGNGNNGTLVNGPTWTTGKVGSGALSFNGINDYVNSGSASSLDTLGPLTIAAWIYPTAALGTTNNSVVGKSGDYYLGFITSYGNKLYFRVPLASTNLQGYCSSFAFSSLNQWYHVAVTWNGVIGTGNTATFYINGSPCAFIGSNGSGARSSSAFDLYIGANNSGVTGHPSDYFPGGIDEARVYNRALSAQEVLDIYNDAGGTVTPPPPPPSDTTAPSVPANLTATAISSLAVNLSWSASTDNVGVTGYKVYRGGAQIGTSVTNSYSDTGLTANTAYAYTVSAYDAAGNNSGQSSSASATTQPTAITHTYWVSPTGAASWANCKSDNLLNGSAACALSTANQNAVAGDTVYLRGGTYTFTSASVCGNNYNCGVFPKNRGTANARITFSAYTGETPVLTVDSTAPTYTTGLTILQGAAGIGTYIRVTGITFHNMPQWAKLYNYASYNEIDHNTFYSDTGEDFSGAAGIAIYSQCPGSGSVWTCYSKHNWVHHNSLSKAHEYGHQNCNEGADLIRIGHGYPSPDPADNATSEKDDYNTVEYNTVAYAGHTLMDTYGGFNVIRGNIFHNEAWITDYSGGTCHNPPMPNGLYGHRGLQTTEDYARPAQSILVEGNRFGFTAANPNNPGEGSYSIASSATIVRYNDAFGAHQSGITTKYYRGFVDGISTTLSSDIDDTVTTIPVASTIGVTAAPTSEVFFILIGSERLKCSAKTADSFTGCTRGYLGTTRVAHSTGTEVDVNSKANRGQGGNGPYNDRIYNNTSFWNGQTDPYWQSATPGCGTCPGKLAGINVYDLAQRIVVKNNIATSNYSYTLYGFDITVDTGQNPANYPNAITATNNWTTPSGDPKFTNPDVTDPTSKILPDLSLQMSSQAIDDGTNLTQASGAGSNSTTLVVKDAMYFQDGTWGSDLARGVDFFPDWIAIGTVDNIVQIRSIDYTANTITLASPMTWNSGANIWLYKKSDGTRVLYGSAPDMGAYEYAGVATPPPDTTPPAAPTGVNVQ
jgi:chitodextrinase